mgnify:CR=1 FL=1
MAASWVAFAWANRLCVARFVETITLAIIGTLFNNERRQMPFGLDGSVMRALLSNEHSLEGVA